MVPGKLSLDFNINIVTYHLDCNRLLLQLISLWAGSLIMVPIRILIPVSCLRVSYVTSTRLVGSLRSFFFLARRKSYLNQYLKLTPLTKLLCTSYLESQMEIISYSVTLNFGQNHLLQEIHFKEARRNLCACIHEMGREKRENLAFSPGVYNFGIRLEKESVQKLIWF